MFNLGGNFLKHIQFQKNSLNVHFFTLKQRFSWSLNIAITFANTLFLFDYSMTMSSE